MWLAAVPLSTQKHNHILGLLPRLLQALDQLLSRAYSMTFHLLQSLIFHSPI